jgi:hypothetical protein
VVGCCFELSGQSIDFGGEFFEEGSSCCGSFLVVEKIGGNILDLGCQFILVFQLEASYVVGHLAGRVLHHEDIFVELIVGDIANVAIVDSVGLELGNDVLVFEMLDAGVVLDRSENSVEERD